MVRLTREGAPNLFIYKHDISLHRGRERRRRTVRRAPRARKSGALGRVSEWRRTFEFVPRIEAIAREAGALLLHYFHQRVKIEYKGDVDLVTVADRSSEKLIVERVRAAWPDHDIVGEEGTRQETGAEYRWYIDPLDGTTNFAHGYPVFCVSMGLERRGEMVAGVLYDPTRDELFAAEKGKGRLPERANRSVFRRRSGWANRCWRRDSRASSGTRTRTSTSITRSHCTRTECGARDRRRWTWRTWRAAAMTDSGNSISIRGIRRRERCWSPRPVAQ